MERNSHSTYSHSRLADPAHPASGGLIRLQARLTDPVTWLGLAWAGLCGVVSSGGFGWHGEDWLRLALLILLVDGGWGTLWAALSSTDWAGPLHRWRDWRSGQPVAMLPYTRPGTPGYRVSCWLGQLRAWWRDAFWPICGPALSAIAGALPVTAVMATLLGTDLLLLSAAALAVMQLGLAWGGGRGEVAPKWDAVIAVTLPWLAGHAAFGTLALPPIALALAFALAWGAAWRADSSWERTLGSGFQFLVAVLLIVLNHPLAAGCLLLLLTPQLALLPWLRRGQSASWYVHHARPWLMAAMLVAAWAL